MKKNYTRAFCIIAGLLFPRQHSIAASVSIQQDGKTTYIVKKGDTIASIAKNLGVSRNHILQENSLPDSSILLIGQSLSISPEQGASITLTKNTSLGAIATQFNIAFDDLMTSNNFSSGSSSTIITSGSEIFIPRSSAQVSTLLAPSVIASKDGGQKVDLSKVSQKIADAYLSTVFDQSFGFTEIEHSKGTILSKFFQKGRGTFGFVAGHCTDYAASRRPDIFTKGKGFRGNAKDRGINAEKAGYSVGRIPQKRAIAVFAPGKGGDKTYGHVAYVERVDLKDNKIEITDMNYLGRNIITRRIIDSRLPVAFIY